MKGKVGEQDSIQDSIHSGHLCFGKERGLFWMRPEVMGGF